jgi:aspartate/glutamate racemase
MMGGDPVAVQQSLDNMMKVIPSITAFAEENKLFDYQQSIFDELMAGGANAQSKEETRELIKDYREKGVDGYQITDSDIEIILQLMYKHGK